MKDTNRDEWVYSRAVMAPTTLRFSSPTPPHHDVTAPDFRSFWSRRRLVHFLLRVHRETARSHVHKQQQPANDRYGGTTISITHIIKQDKTTSLTQRLEEIILQEIPLRMRRVHRPPVVHDNVEARQYEDEERGGPFGFEPDGDHDAGDEADDGDEDASDGPLALDDEAEEEEDEEDAAGEEEAG